MLFTNPKRYSRTEDTAFRRLRPFLQSRSPLYYGDWIISQVRVTVNRFHMIFWNFFQKPVLRRENPTQRGVEPPVNTEIPPHMASGLIFYAIALCRHKRSLTPKSLHLIASTAVFSRTRYGFKPHFFDVTSKKHYWRHNLQQNSAKMQKIWPNTRLFTFCSQKCNIQLL